MGGAHGKRPCTQPLNPDLLSVITLSDSAVQRLPLSIDDKPLDKELRIFKRQVGGCGNGRHTCGLIMGFSNFVNRPPKPKKRLYCLEQAFAETKKLTEKEFQRLEFAIKKMSPGQGKLICPRMVEDTKTSYLTYPGEPLNCTHVVRKLELCLDTVMQESIKKRYEDFKKREKQKNKC